MTLSPDESHREPAIARSRRIQRVLLLVLALLLLAIPCVGLLVVYDFAGQIIYYKYGQARWSRQRPGICSQSRREQVYADMRPEHGGESRLELLSANPLLRTVAAPAQASAQRDWLEYSCDQARALPASSDYATTSDGLRIHYRLFAPIAKDDQSPLLLHVPGITSSWLDGARYAGAARRMGFRLAVLELRNHGISGNDGYGAGYGCREKADVLAVVQALRQRFPGRPMLLWGTSMGSMSILNATATLESFPEVQALILENPPTSLREVVEVSFAPGKPDWLYDAVLAMANLRSGVDYARCSPVALGKDLKLPAFVTVAKADDLTPPFMVEDFYQTLPAGRGHRFKLYPHGQHAAIWNGQPHAYEHDIAAFWRGRPQRPGG